MSQNFSPLGMSRPDGGDQPPGSGTKPSRLAEALFGALGPATFAGHRTLRANLPTVPLRDEVSGKVEPTPHDAALAARLDRGVDWVRVQLTAAELRSRTTTALSTAAGVPAISFSFGDGPELQFVAPNEADVRAAAERVKLGQSAGVTNSDEIVAQASDAGLFIAIALGLNPVEFRHFLMLFDVLELVLAVPLYEAKLHLDVNRPNTWLPEGSGIETVVPVPSHQSFPSGHMSYATALVEMLIRVLPFQEAQTKYLRQLATRIGHNRELAGLHTDLDTAAGRQLGGALGGWLADASRSPNQYPKWATLVAAAQSEWKLEGDEI